MPGGQGQTIPLVVGTAEDEDIQEQTSGQAEDESVGLVAAHGLRVPKVRIARPSAGKLEQAVLATATTFLLEAGVEFPAATTMYLTALANNTLKLGDRPYVWKGTMTGRTFTITQTYKLMETGIVHEAAPTGGLTGDRVHVLQAFIRDPSHDYAGDGSIGLARRYNGSTAYDVVSGETDITEWSIGNTTQDGHTCVRMDFARTPDPTAGDLVCILTPQSPSTQMGVALDRGTVVTRLDDTTIGRFAVNMLPSYSIRVADADDLRVALKRQQTALPVPVGMKNAFCPSPFWPITKDANYQSQSQVGHNLATVVVPWHPIVSTQAAFLVEGLEDVGDASGNLIENAADVLLELIENTALGAVAAADIDATSFATARDLTYGIDFGFVIEQPRDLLEVIGDLAFQAGLWVHHFDLFTCVTLDNAISAADSVATITASGAVTDYLAGSMVIEQQDLDDVTTEVRISRVGKDGKESVRSTAAETARGGPKVVDLDLWAVQKQAMRLDVARFWASRWCNLYEYVTFDVGLALTKLLPGDVVVLNITDSASQVLFSSVPFRITHITDHMDAGRITVRAERILFNYAVDDLADGYYTYLAPTIFDV